MTMDAVELGSMLYFAVVLVFGATALAFILSARKRSDDPRFRSGLLFLAAAIVCFMVDAFLDLMGGCNFIPADCSVLVQTYLMSAVMGLGFLALLLAAWSFERYSGN